MPYNTKEKYLAYVARRALGRPSKRQRICPVCQVTFVYEQGRTKGDACTSCYNKYRQLYNLIHSAKHRATKFGLEFDLDIGWAISQPSVCPYTNVSLSYEKNGSDYSNRNPFAASIDKINPSKGYTKDNCQIVCWWFNCAKQRYTTEEVVNLCRLVVDTYTMNHAQDVENKVETEEGTT